MSEEKLYAVKDDKGYYWEFKDLCGSDLGGFWELFDVSVPFTVSEDDAKNTAKDHGGHVVTLIEEPKKVVLTKEQAEIVEEARLSDIPATYISERTPSYDEEPLMNALVNGYTVEKDNKYNVKVPLVQAQGGLWFYINSEDKLGATYLKKMAKKFTIDEIEHYELQDCEKVEVEENGGLDK